MIRIALLLLCVLAFAASAPAASAAKTCHLTLNQQRHSGSTYLIQLRVKNVSCKTGLKIEKAWQSCRRATPGHRTCRRRVDRYSCKQKVLDSSPTQYDARVTCTRGARVVVFTYTQNT
jgi:hypothetical protein